MGKQVRKGKGLGKLHLSPEGSTGSPATPVSWALRVLKRMAWLLFRPWEFSSKEQGQLWVVREVHSQQLEAECVSWSRGTW